MNTWIRNIGIGKRFRQGWFGACALAALTFAGSAEAASITGVSIISGNDPVANDEEVQFNDGLNPVPAFLLKGETNQTNFVVNFESNELIKLQGQGQAKIVSGDGNGFQTLDIFLQEPATFESLILKVTGSDPNSDVIFTGWNSTGSLLGSSDPFLVQGDGFFTLLTDASTSLSRLRITSNGGLNSIEIGNVGQVRIGGAANPAGVPLPGVAVAGLVLFGGLGGIGGLKRLRRKSLVAA